MHQLVGFLEYLLAADYSTFELVGFFEYLLAAASSTHELDDFFDKIAGFGAGFGAG
jgi:hypothetical protein